MRRVVVIALVAVAALAAGRSALAGHECDGLDVCVSVPGPWVVIPAPTAATDRSTTYYYLRCARRGYIIGGIDANVSERAIAIHFLGNLGSPVSPGVSTTRELVFAATYTGRTAHATSFQPLIGCMPTSGGGRGTTSVGAAAPRPDAYPPWRATTRRLAPGDKKTVNQSCRHGERLVSSSSAVAFRRKGAPSRSLIGAVHATRRVNGNTVIVDVTVAKSLPKHSHAEVQVLAVCSRS